MSNELVNFYANWKLNEFKQREDLQRKDRAAIKDLCDAAHLAFEVNFAETFDTLKALKITLEAISYDDEFDTYPTAHTKGVIKACLWNTDENGLKVCFLINFIAAALVDSTGAPYGYSVRWRHYRESGHYLDAELIDEPRMLLLAAETLFEAEAIQAFEKLTERLPAEMPEFLNQCDQLARQIFIPDAPAVYGFWLDELSLNPRAEFVAQAIRQKRQPFSVIEDVVLSFQEQAEREKDHGSYADWLKKMNNFHISDFEGWLQKFTNGDTENAENKQPETILPTSPLADAIGEIISRTDFSIVISRHETDPGYIIEFGPDLDKSETGETLEAAIMAAAKFLSDEKTTNDA